MLTRSSSKFFLSTLCSSRLSSQNAASTSTSTTIDQKEVDRFEELSGEWSDEGGPFKALHAFNRLRIPWIVGNSQKNGKVLDVGCGGGLLSVPLARAGLNVTGLDPTHGVILAARESLQSRSLQATNVAKRVQFICSDIEKFAAEHENVASEVVEHVANVPLFVTALAKAVKPGGRIFMTTINRTWASKLLSIWVAENILGIVPRGMHQWEKFVTPEELRRNLEENNCRIISNCGLAYEPFCNNWHWIPFDGNNYAILAEKMS